MKHASPRTYLENRLRDHFGPHGVGCLVLGKHYNRWMYRVRKRRFRAITKSFELRYTDLDVLDIGSGTGFYIERWKELGVKSVSGLDFSGAAVHRLQRRISEDTFYEIDIGESPLPPPWQIRHCLGIRRAFPYRRSSTLQDLSSKRSS